MTIKTTSSLVSATEKQCEPAWTEAVGKYLSARAAVETAKQNVIEAASEAFEKGCRALFESYPHLVSFTWLPPYTVRSICELYSEIFCSCCKADINDINKDGRFEWEFNSGDWKGEGEPSAKAILQQSVKRFLETFDEDDLLDLFGPDVWIKAHHDGTIVTEDYFIDD